MKAVLDLVALPVPIMILVRVTTYICVTEMCRRELIKSHTVTGFDLIYKRVI